MATKDKKIALRLKKEMSMTGTGASVTSGTGEGVATKYAFGKTNKSKPEGWKDAPSVPNRKSKAMDYKELWEEENEWPEEVLSRHRDIKFIKQKTSSDKATYQIVDLENNNKPIGDMVFGSVKNLKDFADDYIKPQGGRQSTQLEEGKMHIGTDTKTDSDVYFDTETGTFHINVIDAAGNRWNKLQVNTIDDVLAKFKPNWKWTKAGEAKFSDALDEATGFKSGKEFINIKLQKYPKALSKVNNLINMIGEDKFTMDVAEWVWDFFNNTGFEQPINEGYAQFRNETKTRTKPEQFHSAVKEVKKKVNEINRLFEYMNRLQSELSESEGGLKYKKYTEKALQQIKESTKQLFFKSTKLK